MQIPFYRVIASEQSWLEGNALEQLKQTAALPGMQLTIGLPDLHAGKGHPVGAAFWSQGCFYPFLVGSDIGCGMGLWQSDLPVRKLKKDRWAQKLDLEAPLPTPAELALPDYPGQGFGTIGGGNHFAELQQVESLHDAAAFAALGLNPDQLQLLVHSGSRGLGEAILRKHTAQHSNAALAADSPEAALYLQAHDQAIRWAEANREAIQQRFLHSLGGTGQRCLDVCHNSVTLQDWNGQQGFLHRKGAAPADQGPIVIPGSRGSFSYLVKPLQPGAASGWSLAHGAGRKWSRQDARSRIKQRFHVPQLEQTALGSRVICHDRNLLYEEAPEAYKAIDQVIADLLAAELIQLIAVLRPVITYKTRQS